MQALPEVGFFGKLPSNGDFLRRNVLDICVDQWDPWLQAAMSASREALGEQWLDLYLTAPMWRFFTPGGVIDQTPVTGVLFPSVDRVGRYFPLTVFARLPADAPGLLVIDRCTDWFESIERLVIAQLDESPLPLADFEAQLAASAGLLAAAVAPIANPATTGATCERGGHLHVPIEENLDVKPAALGWMDEMLRRGLAHPVYWWTAGSASVAPCWLVTDGLPETRAFAGMLAGTFDEWPWTSRGHVVAGPVLMTRTMQMTSAGSTHAGKVRTINQDAFLARPEIGLFMVADGMGGHTDGHVASQMTRDTLAGLNVAPSMHEWVAGARAALDEVNAYLHASSTRPVNPTLTGTTVVLLLIRGTSAACLWAGDSRLYRLRDGALEQLTTDHDDRDTQEVEEGAPKLANVITRAVGGAASLDLDQMEFEVRAGDRFLLCSDGLYRELDHATIAALLGTGDATAVVQSMVEAVLKTEAADNLTAVVVDAAAHAD
jgi:type VI secretion system ImpM family protein